MSLREQTLVAWAGLRGAVPIILATFPLVAGLQQADMIFHMVFFIALTSVVIQGTAIPWITRLLKIGGPQLNPQAPPNPMP
jgi:cell volume regulation protein A